MRKVLLLLVTLTSATAAAQPVQIDLMPERRAYEARARPRTAALVLLAGTLVLAGATAYGYTEASTARAKLLDQRTPVNLTQREALISQGERGNIIGIAAGALGAVVFVTSLYLISVSL